MTEKLFENDAYLRNCTAEVTAVSANGFILDRTVFYPMGGGQPGDSGRLLRSDGSFVVIDDTRKSGDDIVHVVSAEASLPVVGELVEVELDWERRHRHMRMHTCMHLLCAIVDAPVSGGNLAADKGRLDFDLPEPTVNKEDLTEALNQLVLRDEQTIFEWITDAELDAQPELVKTMSVSPPRGAGKVRLVRIAGIDLQPCGGTHVARTSEIGRVRVSKIEKKSRLNRRIAVVFDG